MKIVKLLGVVLSASILSSCGGQGVSKKPLKTEIDSVSYALGANMGSQIRINASEIDKEVYIRGFFNAIY
jgi:hypothetical protein